MSVDVLATRLQAEKFRDPDTTANGEARARVALRGLETLWFNTGTLCNLTCAHCYIESSPSNDRLAYLTTAEVAGYLDEIARDGHPTRLIGFTGGEPFMNPDLPDMLALALARGFSALVLTNAMRPMAKMQNRLAALAGHGARLELRVSIDQPDQAAHEAERGPRSWAPTLSGLRWLAEQGFYVSVAGRMFGARSEATLRADFARLFARIGVDIDATDPGRLVLFPEMDALADVPEITTACWGILQKSPDSVMCATSRMVVKHRDRGVPSVAACTLLPYDPQFDLGPSLASASRAVALNHPHCATFCVLGGAACSAG